MKTTKMMILALTLLLTCPIVTCAQKKQTKKTATEVKKDTLTVLTEKATAGDAVAQNTLGYWYYTGNHVQKNYETAVEWWTKSAEQDNAYAIGNMAMCYQLGRGVSQDSLTAMDLYKKAVRKGNKDIVTQHEKLAEKKENLFSNALMYELYTSGIGVKSNPAKAASYLECLAEAGDADKQYKLALYYLNSNQADKAFPWFKTAAEKGKTGAIFYSGYLLHQGMGISQDKAEGIHLMEQAEEKGFTEATYQLGKIFYDGDGTEQDFKKAVAYLQKAAPKSGNAQWLLGLCYLKGQGVDKNYYFATQWLAESAKAHQKELNELVSEESESVFSQYLLGLRKYYVDKDYDAAIACFKNVEKAKIAEGKTMQGICFANKDYDKRNLKKAVKLLTKAAAASSAACYYLSAMYESGIGVKKDEKKALELLQQAADNGIAYAQCKLGDKYMTGNGVVQDYTKAAQLYLAAEAQKHLTPSSAKNLAKCYQKHIGILPNLEHADNRIKQLQKQEANNKLINLLKQLENK